MTEQEAENDAFEQAVQEALAWRDKLPRTPENDTYANGRQDGVNATVRIFRALLGSDMTFPPGEPTAGDPR
jgi:hypothetical protein